MAKQGAKEIIGTLDIKKNAIIEYKGFSTNICVFADKFNQAKGNDLSELNCKKEGNNYYILAQGAVFTNINPESIWPDLTSKLRLK